MEKATYGRMRLGRCVKTDFGFIGCDVDVLPVLDTACSGRRGCQFTVIEPNFPNRPPCNNEFKNHLELEYICVDGVGCRPLKPPGEGMWMTRRGDTVDAGCRASGRTWQLRCVDTSWVGVLGNCTRVVQRQEETTQERHVKGYALPTPIVCVGVFCVRRRGQHVAVSQHDPRVVLDRVRQVPPNDSKGVSFPTSMRTSFHPPETDYACTSHECPHECPYDWAYHGTPDCCRSSGEVTMKPYIVPSDCL
ncbi:hypothetical protein NP493_742g01000 [Ridgeia piscesae]|uniref:SUEL-type lectin domain-containing protein n=1 Tax=Ridgeia piscesae TaxID=27915 RepID=A0AAD9KPY6_RIDPI|nr:hypothetical protein NP493_742g01000 [Ridgeia piscesae]